MIAKSMFGWWTKLLSMSPERLPRICFQRLIALSANFPDPKFNWTLQLKDVLEEAGLEDLWSRNDVAVVKGAKDKFLSSLLSSLHQADLSKAAVSSFNYCPRGSNIQPLQRELYLSSDHPLFSKRLLAQIRCANPAFCKIVLHHAS
ncbi:hypothetical protein GE061_006629 [Apolygus lucorum]|uniref:Uncharacterized protein n=1 Tax=Apolygus lucorum TaxID=248454 RepID=A0A8S9WX00_APOLU|nr:hypothetical protein GE061_006629 [Apolygus lucorum]